MKVIYAIEPVLPNGDSIFLAGPTPRNALAKSWRPAALDVLASKNWAGTVYVPETRDGQWKRTYQDQVDWEEEALTEATCIVFWVPREINHMPAFTTNIEFGMWYRSGKIVLGFPKQAPKMRYLEHHARKHGVQVNHSLDDTIANALHLVSWIRARRCEHGEDPKACQECQALHEAWRETLRRNGGKWDPEIFTLVLAGR